MLLKFFIVGIIMQASYAIGPFLLPLGIKDRPFSAEFELVKSKKLSGGKIFKQSGTGKIYRDAEGRTRIEERQKNKEEGSFNTVIIYNPSKLEGYLLDTEAKTFFTMPLLSSNSKSEVPTYEGDDIGSKVIENLVCRGYRVKR